MVSHLVFAVYLAAVLVHFSHKQSLVNLFYHVVLSALVNLEHILPTASLQSGSFTLELLEQTSHLVFETGGHLRAFVA